MSRLRVRVVLQINVDLSYSHLRHDRLRVLMRTAGVCDDVDESSGKSDIRWVIPNR